MNFLYETHMHTCQGSACSDTLGREYIARYMDEGYAGIIITDHFWGGNCAVDRSLPWTEFVKRFCAGYEDALNEGIRRNFPVFFGWEETFEGDDYLVYGLDRQWLVDHPEVIHWSRKEQFEEVHRAGGCVVQAHPFRAASYITAIHLSPDLVDGIEGFNAGNQPNWNIIGMRYAQVTGKPITAGSDNHHADRMSRENLAGVILDYPMTCIQDYVQTILKQKPHSLKMPYSLELWSEAVPPERPVYRGDREGVEREMNLRELYSWLSKESLRERA